MEKNKKVKHYRSRLSKKSIKKVSSLIRTGAFLAALIGDNVIYLNEKCVWNECMGQWYINDCVIAVEKLKKAISASMKST